MANIAVIIQAGTSAPRPVECIPNGTFFTGALRELERTQVMLKLGSIGTETWLVTRLSDPSGMMLSSNRDEGTLIYDYQALDVQSVTLALRGEDALR